MEKEKMLKEIQKRLPDDILISDETSFDFTEDEYISILCWIKYFNKHYIDFGKTKLPYIKFPIISKRLRLEFGLYIYPCGVEDSKNLGKHVIYIIMNNKMSLKQIIETWTL